MSMKPFSPSLKCTWTPLKKQSVPYDVHWKAEIKWASYLCCPIPLLSIHVISLGYYYPCFPNKNISLQMISRWLRWDYMFDSLWIVPWKFPVFICFPFLIKKSPPLTFPSWFFPLENSILLSILQAGQQSVVFFFSTLLNNIMSTTETNEQGDDRSSSSESEVQRPRKGGKGGHHKREEPTSLAEL